MRSNDLPAVLVAAAILAGCGRSTQAAQPVPAPVRIVEGDSAAIARASADSVRYPYTAADLHFMAGMIAHHAQAIRMASWASSHRANPEVVRLAERVINAQQDEIVLMQQWLADRRQPVPEPSPHGMKMVRDGQEHVMLMPGMLTEAQLRELEAARGPAFDRLFLRFMIQHHQGAVTMVKELFATPGAGVDLTVFKLAAGVHVDQLTEIRRMEQMLAALPPS